MSLVRVELTRLRWRRAVLLLLVAAVLAPVVFWAGVAWSTRPVSAEERARAEAEVASERERGWWDEEIESCLADPEGYGITDASDVRVACEDAIMPTVDDFLYRAELSVSSELGNTGLALVSLLAVLLVVLGTTFVGHDWNTGSMSNQLLFVPRRGRVWAAKAVALALIAALLSAAVLAAYAGALNALAASRDLPTVALGEDGVLGAGLRAVVLCVGAVLFGYALTTLFRSTVATLGVFVVGAVVGTALLEAVLGGSATAQPWLPHVNVAAWLQNGYEYWIDDPACYREDAAPGCGVRTLGLAHAAAYLGAALAACCALSLWSFRRRDLP